MAQTLRLTVLTGPHQGEKFCFCGSSKCFIGRGPECFVQLAGTPRDRLVSRRHCELEINLPEVKLQDLGSQNGTFVNGVKVVSNPFELDYDAEDMVVCSGDFVTIGGTTFRADIVECPPADMEIERSELWSPGDVAKKDCPVPCNQRNENRG